jgi:hypothetical protein
MNGQNFVPLVVRATFTSLKHVFVEVRYRDTSPVQLLLEENFGFAISEQGEESPYIVSVQSFGRHNHDGMYEMRIDDRADKSGNSPGLYTVHITRVSAAIGCIESGRTTVSARGPWTTGIAGIDTWAS